MDHIEIRELAALMKEAGLTSLEYRRGDESVKMRRPEESTQTATQESSNVSLEQCNAESVSGNMFTVKSPMVGIFYSAPGADEEPYVLSGDTVSVGDVLCVIEAMKIMNEITAERDGVITEICVENKQVVEYGQPLFRISSDEQRVG